MIQLLPSIYLARFVQINSFKREKGIRQVRFKGIIIPVDWDEKGNIIRLAIATNTEEELPIKDDTNGRKLFNHIQEHIEILAEIADVAGEQVLSIQEFQIL